jgi:hypothetical protein
VWHQVQTTALGLVSGNNQPPPLVAFYGTEDYWPHLDSHIVGPYQCAAVPVDCADGALTLVQHMVTATQPALRLWGSSSSSGGSSSRQAASKVCENAKALAGSAEHSPKLATIGHGTHRKRTPQTFRSTAQHVVQHSTTATTAASPPLLVS